MAKKRSTKRKENHYGNPANYGKQKEEVSDVFASRNTGSLKDWNLLSLPAMALGLIADKNIVLVIVALIMNVIPIVQYFFNMKRGTALAICGLLFTIKAGINCIKNGVGLNIDWQVTIGYIISSLIVSAITIGIIEIFYIVKRHRKKHSKKVG